MPALTYRTLVDEGVLDALADAFDSRDTAQTLLASIDYPRRRIPRFPADGSLVFWSRVCQSIDNGLIDGGLNALVAAAARIYPFNPHLLPFGNNQAPVRLPPGNRIVSLLVSGVDDPQQLLDAARAHAGEQGMSSESVELAFSNTEGVLLNLVGWTTEQALALATHLRGALQTGDTPPRTSIASSDYRDYLIGQLYVEGPDQSRFEINNVRGSTRIRDIAEGVVTTQYDPKVFGRDGKGQPRQAVVDRVGSDGVHARLNPDQSLHDQNIRDGDTLAVSPEARAGAMNPLQREEALVRAFNQVVAYAQSHQNFLASANSTRAPTEYMFRFRASSFGPPSGPGGSPTRIDDHEVFLVLSPNFPTQAPEAFWQTPIFHPNIHPKVGKLCFGALEEGYRPGLDFGYLCETLVEIAAYRSYAADNGYNLEAQKWAMSPEGQVAIEMAGGVSVLRSILREHEAPRPLSIKRLKV